MSQSLLTYGFRRTLPRMAGVTLGGAFMVGAVGIGLGAVFIAYSVLKTILKYAGAAYLIFLGVRMWRASAAQSNEPRTGQAKLSRSFLLGASIALGNPKAILFHASIMPLILDLDTMTFFDGLLVVATVISVNIVTMGVYAALAGRASGWFRTPRRMRLMNRFAGSAMIGTGALIAAR